MNKSARFKTLCSRPFAVASLAIGALTLSALQTQGADFTQTNLVSNITGLAKITDPQLVNPWGVSHSPTSPFWTSNQGKNTATLYAVTGETTVTKVNINPRTNAPLRRQYLARPRRCLRQQFPRLRSRPGRIPRSLAAGWASPVQRAGHRRQCLRGLCTRGSPGPDHGSLGGRRRGGL